MRAVVDSLRAVVKWVVPSFVLRNRGYLPGLIPAAVLWGSLMIVWLSWAGDGEMAQQVVNATTYLCLFIGGVTVATGAWGRTSKRKVAVAVLWSVGGMVSYIAIGLTCIAIGLTISGAIGLDGETRIAVTMGIGGLVTIYTWYRVNWRFFRWIKGPGSRKVLTWKRG